MGLITRCPACGTMFKVVADQLRISEGWVRCGHCAEIFDAAAELRNEAELQRHGSQPEFARAEEESSPASGYPASVHSEVPASAIDEMPDALEIEEQAHAMHEHPLDRPFELRRADPAEESQSVGAYGYSRPVPLEPEPELHDLGFVQQARRREFWGKGPVRVLLVLLLVALAALLAGQVAFNDRDRLAASSPALRPWLARMCEALRCSIRPPRSIESVSIETSAFNKLRGETYRLSVTLRNQGTLPVAMPALELTLTDSQDQAVLRRVLQPSEFAPGTAAIQPGVDWSTSVGVAVNAAASGGRVAGYRVLAFYP
jgi:predicted Zn finger-like uncharacterized protein